MFAIDPAELQLHPLPPSITHLRLRAEEAVPLLRAALAESGERLALVLCDANVHPPAAARLALSLAHLLPADEAGGDLPKAALVISEKRFASGRAAHAADCDAAEALLCAAGWGRIERLHLFANGGSERTLVATRG